MSVLIKSSWASVRGKSSQTISSLVNYRPKKWRITADVRQPWTNYVNNGNKHLIVGAEVRSEYSNIWYLHLIIGKAQKFVLGDKYDFWG